MLFLADPRLMPASCRGFPTAHINHFPNQAVSIKVTPRHCLGVLDLTRTASDRSNAGPVLRRRRALDDWYAVGQPTPLGHRRRPRVTPTIPAPTAPVQTTANRRVGSDRGVLFDELQQVAHLVERR